MSDVSQGPPGWWKAPGRKLHALLGRLLAALALVFAVAFPVGAVFAFTAQVAGASTDTVTNCNDSGAGSLRQTIADASAGDTIDFDMSPACSVITLTSGYIEITQKLTIEGPGAGTLALSGDDPFVVDTAETVAISGLSFSNVTGAAVENTGSLTVTDSTFSDDSQAISNGGRLTVTGSTFTDNGYGRRDRNVWLRTGHCHRQHLYGQHEHGWRWRHR